MGTRRSRHNKGRKPLYKEHRLISAELLSNVVASEPRQPSLDMFLKSEMARSLTVKLVAELSREAAYEVFKAIRWPETDGKPVCPRCDAREPYQAQTKAKPRWHCRVCRFCFTATSGTVFSARKLDYRDLLMVIAEFVGQKRGTATAIVDNIDCTLKSAYTLLAKLRLAAEQQGRETFSIDRPRYFDSGFHSTRTWWSDAEKSALDRFVAGGYSPDEAAVALGRTPRSIAWYARDRDVALPREWSTLITPRRLSGSPAIQFAYPYILSRRPEHADLLAVNDLVPHAFPAHMRADICQEVMVAIFEGRVTLADLRANRKQSAWFFKKFWKDNHEDGGRAISLSGQEGDDRSYDEIASSIAAKGWFEGERDERGRHWDAFLAKSFQPPTQIAETYAQEVRWKQHELQRLDMPGLSFEDVEDMMERGEVGPAASLRQKACEWKQRHKTEDAAQAAAMATSESTSNKLHGYRCPHCDGWHVGRVRG